MAEDSLVTPPTSGDRSSQVLRWLLSGATEAEILEAIRQTYPEADAPAMLKQAFRQVWETANADAITVHAWTFEAAKDLYRQMVETGDFKTALRALKFMQDTAIRIAGLRPEEDEPQDKDVSSTAENPEDEGQAEDAENPIG